MQQYLGVDIGNSGLRISELQLAGPSLGETKRIEWLHGDSIRADRPRYRPHDTAWLRELDAYLSPASPASVWYISSVRRDAASVLKDAVAKAGHAYQHITFRDLPLLVRVEEPSKVGIDRLLAAVAANAMVRADRRDGEPLIVIQAGSAVTVDLVFASAGDERPSFEGGAILPGVPMMLRLLGQAADMLPEVDADELLDLPPLPGTNTEQAMRCGAGSALVGGVMHLIDRYRSNYGRQVPVILSGGDGMRIAQYIDAPLQVASHLVQRGLLVLAVSDHREKTLGQST